MLKKIFLIGFVSILALSQQGYSKDLAGRFALGIFDSEAPIGCRYWFTPRLGLDIGFGIEAVEENSDHAKSIWLGFGFPYVLHAADRANFFLRPSLLLKSLDDRIHGTGRLEENWTEYEILARSIHKFRFQGAQGPRESRGHVRRTSFRFSSIPLATRESFGGAHESLRDDILPQKDGPLLTS